jgi:hypothetical protein
MAEMRRRHLFGTDGMDRLTAEAFTNVCRRVGCKGPHPFAQLPYCDLSCLFPVPIGHALLFGVARDLVDYLLRPLKDIKPNDADRGLVISRESRHLIVDRGTFITVTSDFGRRYKCVLTYRHVPDQNSPCADCGLAVFRSLQALLQHAPSPPRRGSYRMEDWLHFLETFSAYVFKGNVLPDAFRELWWLLVDVVKHYFRPRPEDETREQFLTASTAAAGKLRRYAERLQELGVPGHMFTINLHLCVCRWVLQGGEWCWRSGAGR